VRKVAIAIVATLVVVFGGGYAFYRAAFPHETVRYRLTFEADVDGKPATGSGVIQVTQYDTTAVFRNMGGAGTEVIGEAVVVDLDRDGPIFFLLHGPKLGLPSELSPGALLFAGFASEFGHETDPLARMRILERQRPARDLAFNLVPMVVRFRDLRDPTSVEQLNPSDFARVFGPTVVLRRATIQITSDPVTTGIESRLPWLSRLKDGGALDGSRIRINNELKSNLGYLSFKREGV